MLSRKILETRAKGDKSLLAKMWVYSGLHDAPYNVFDFRVSRHRDGPDDFFKNSNNCKVLGDCFSGNRSVVLHSEGRLEFVACWSHARRKVVESSTYPDLVDQLLGMILALYDIETRAKNYTVEQRKALRQGESKLILASIDKWLHSPLLDSVLPKSDLQTHPEAIRSYRQEERRDKASRKQLRAARRRLLKKSKKATR